MNIQLKQAEIVKALEQYISNKGFSLDGKKVSIEFTAGRKAGGLIADLVIEDADIPGFTDAEETSEQKTTLTVVDNSDKPKLDTAAIASAAQNVILEEDKPAVEEQAADTSVAAVAEPEAPKPSLFS